MTMLPTEQDIEILLGVTWSTVTRWLTDSMVHKPISAVAIGLPTNVTATAHGLDNSQQQPVWITGVNGPRALNTDDYKYAEPRWVDVVDADTLAVDFDSSGLSAYTNGGTLTYRVPMDLTGWSGALSIYGNVGDATPLLVIDTSSNGGVTLDAHGNITTTITAEQSTALGLLNGWYKLELTDAAGNVTRVLEGAAAVVLASTD